MKHKALFFTVFFICLIMAGSSILIPWLNILGVVLFCTFLFWFTLAQTPMVLPAEDQPRPGSKDALALGCTCPVERNYNGEGTLFIDDKAARLFVVANSCPVHRRVER